MIKTIPVLDPYLLRCRNHGLIIVLKENRKWTVVIAKSSSQVYIKRIRNSELEYNGHPFEYPGGVAAAADKFLHPTLGIAIVSPTAQRELENIMKNYATKANAKRALKKIGDYALSRADEFIIKNAEGDYELDDAGAEAYELGIKLTSKPIMDKALKTTRQNTKRYVKITESDFSKRRGGFRLTLDAVAAGHKTAQEIWDAVKQTMPNYKLADIYTDLSMGRKYGYVREE